MTCHVPTGGKLFARDEMDEIQGELIPIMKKEFPRRPPTNENLYKVVSWLFASQALDTASGRC